MAWRLGARPTVSAPPVRVGEAAEESLPSVRRDFYLEHPVVAAMTPEAAEAERARLGILVHGSSACPNPVGSFLQASFPQYVLDALAKADFLEPTPIQRQAWPIAMQGSDLVGLAETGSGKTLAFLLPAIVHVNAQPVLEEGDGPLALILAPTRELAVQIADECVRFGHPCGVSTLCVYGGVPKQPQVQALRKAPEVLVATPGRLNDLLSSRKTELSRCTYFVVDEADRMLDLGFEPQLRSVLTHMRADRQTLFFSATWPAEVQELASRLLLPGSITVEVGGALTDAGKANRRISQLVVMCSADDKLSTLVGLLEELMDGSRILVFCASKRRCDEVTRALRQDSWPALAIHGDKSQEERDWVLQQFKDGREPLLVATDVAQRGLDIKAVRCVVNYDCPATSESYVHRIGRTGRAGSAGTAYTLVTPDDGRVARDLVKVLRGSGQPVPAQLDALADKADAEARYKAVRA